MTTYYAPYQATPSASVGHSEQHSTDAKTHLCQHLAQGTWGTSLDVPGPTRQQRLVWRLTSLLQVQQETHPFDKNGSQLLGQFLVDSKNLAQTTYPYLQSGSYFPHDSGVNGRIRIRNRWYLLHSCSLVHIRKTQLISLLMASTS